MFKCTVIEQEKNIYPLRNKNYTTNASKLDISEISQNLENDPQNNIISIASFSNQIKT